MLTSVSTHCWASLVVPCAAWDTGWTKSTCCPAAPTHWTSPQRTRANGKARHFFVQCAALAGREQCRNSTAAGRAVSTLRREMPQPRCGGCCHTPCTPALIPVLCNSFHRLLHCHIGDHIAAGMKVRAGRQGNLGTGPAQQRSAAASALLAHRPCTPPCNAATASQGIYTVERDPSLPPHSGAKPGQTGTVRQAWAAAVLLAGLLHVIGWVLGACMTPYIPYPAAGSLLACTVT